MKRSSGIALAASLALGLAFAAVPAAAQQPAAPQLKPVSASALQAARDLLAVKRVSGVYASAVPNIVQRTKDAILASNLSYQKDLEDVAQNISKAMAGKESEIGEQMAKIYANDFTEQELKDLATFYKSALGQKVLSEEPKAIQDSMNFMGQWAQAFQQTVIDQFREEMKKRGKPLAG